MFQVFDRQPLKEVNSTNFMEILIGVKKFVRSPLNELLVKLTFITGLTTYDVKSIASIRRNPTLGRNF